MTITATSISALKKMTGYLYCLLMIAVCVYTYKKQAYNWDILPYMAVVLSYENKDATAVHQTVYSIAKKEIPTQAFSQLTDTFSSYRKLMAASPDEFRLQLPFYSVKPLYTGICYLFYKAGLPLTRATALPSLLSWWLIAMLLYWWIRKYHSTLFAACTSTLLMLMPPLLLTAQLSSPDSLSGLLIFAAVFYSTEKKRYPIAALLLLLSVFTRLDNLLPAFFISLAVYYQEKSAGRISLPKYILFLLALVISYVSITAIISTSNWGVLYYPAFASHLNPYYDIHRSFSFSGYISLAKSQLMTGLYYSLLLPYLLLSFLYLYGSKPRSFTLEQRLCSVFLVIIAIRFVLQPAIADRFYIGYYLAAIVFLLTKRRQQGGAATGAVTGEYQLKTPSQWISSVN
jgi:hypothetical protein